MTPKNEVSKLTIVSYLLISQFMSSGCLVISKFIDSLNSSSSNKQIWQLWETIHFQLFLFGAYSQELSSIQCSCSKPFWYTLFMLNILCFEKTLFYVVFSFLCFPLFSVLGSKKFYFSTKENFFFFFWAWNLANLVRQ